MRNFSIISNWDRDPINQYTDFLTNEVYKSAVPWSYADVENPLFLQKLGVLRAAGIQKAIETNGAVNVYGLSKTNETVRQSAQHLSRQLGASASIITSSLDRGFTALNHSLGYIGSGIDTTNNQLTNISSTLGDINTNLETTNKNFQTLGMATTQGFAALHRNIGNVNENLKTLGMATTQGFSTLHSDLKNIQTSLNALAWMTGQGFSRLYNQLSISNTMLNGILTELKIPETQRERRYHIEEGTKYLSMALVDNDKFYFEDAIDEFEKAIAIERKDFFAWYNLGFIYLRSTDFLDIKKSSDAFEQYIHYAKAEIAQRKNRNLEQQLDNVYLMMAEIKYLQQSLQDAVLYTEKCVCLREKADFMKSKYLSATSQRNNQKIAAEILHKLLDTNPLLSLQILEDNDLIANDYITQLLGTLRQEAINKAKKQFLKIKNEVLNLLKKFPYLQTPDLNTIENLIQHNTYLDAIEAIFLIESILPIKVEVGEYYNENGKEGVVFEVDNTGRHGKIVGMKQSIKCWCASEEAFKVIFTGATDESDGMKNLQAIKRIPDWRNKYPAFAWCADLGEGWYLPTFKEMKKLTTDNSINDTVNRTLSQKNEDLLFNIKTINRKETLPCGYWVSSGVLLNLGGTRYDAKYRNHYVRAVSAF